MGLDREGTFAQRGYKWGKEEKLDVTGRKGKDEGTQGAGGAGETTTLAEDEMIVKKEDWKKMEAEIKDLKYEVDKV